MKGQCLTCGKEIEIIEGRRPRKYCSDKCRFKFRDSQQKTDERKLLEYLTEHGITLEMIKERFRVEH